MNVETLNNIQILLKLSLQRALLGAVRPRLYAVTAGVRGKTILIRAYFSEVPSQEDVESIQIVAAEVEADFPEDVRVEEQSVSVSDEPLEVIDFWVFIRASGNEGDKII
jgi:hypothetical protein